jgi:predicted outer membrane repeat protein
MSTRHHTAAAVTIVIAVAGAAPAFAGTIVVAPGDTPGLIAAVQAANADPGHDTISLGAGSTYTFTQGAFNGNALPIITDALTINANGATIERVGPSGFRIITNQSDLTLNDLTLTGGSSGTGAGVRNDALLVLNSCTLSENRGGGNGGAISTAIGTRVEAINTLFHRNSAGGGSGGVIYSDRAEIVFTGCTFTENDASQGGAIDTAGSAIIEDCTFTGNFTTSGLGGGINNYNTGTLEVTGSTFTGNQSGWAGGAISQRGTSATIADCAFVENAALGGGGGAMNAESGAVVIERCEFINNTAQDDGGAINAATPVPMTDCLILGNTAGQDGGGLNGFNSAAYTLDRVTIADNTAARDGGGVRVFGNANAFVNTTISGNQAGNDGGGVWVWGATDSSITNTTVHANTADNTGGGLYIQSGPLALSNTIVSASAGRDVTGPINDLGHNLVHDGSGLTAPTSKSGDPMLAPLADNGGLTPTHHLIFGSPAIHAGDCAGGTVTTDQRGVARPQDPFGCDIGAYEAPPCPPDVNGDVKLNFFDVQQFIAWFVAADPRADVTANGVIDFFDVQAYLATLAAGCH